MFIPKEHFNFYKILSRESAEKYCHQKHQKTSIIISIRSSWDKVMPDVFISKENGVKDICSLAFDDVDIFNEHGIMTIEDGKKIADFINKWYSKTDLIIAHCDGGISRSAGVIAAIMRVKEGTEYPLIWSYSKHPNMLCYLQTLKGFGYIKEPD